jgi:hypothetical protein
LPRIDIHLDADDLDILEPESRPYRQAKRKHDDTPNRRKRTRLTQPPRSEADQAFKCGHCKQFIGAPLAGGRHRNHCPNCLYSRHVDNTRPGDRMSDCHALMEPAGILIRRNGEQVLIHRCLGCGKEDPNRIAADDNPLLLMRLAPKSSPGLELVPAAITEAEETA